MQILQRPEINTLVISEFTRGHVTVIFYNFTELLDGHVTILHTYKASFGFLFEFLYSLLLPLASSDLQCLIKLFLFLQLNLLLNIFFVFHYHFILHFE